jgi:mannonate dehydratase
LYIGEQLINPTADRLRLSAQLGVAHIVIDSRPNHQITGEDGVWDAGKVREQRLWLADLGHSLDVLALDIGSILIDSLRDRGRADATAERLRSNIRAASDGGVETVKHNLQMIGITRTGLSVGRGGVQCSTFRFSDYTPDADAEFSYWGVGYPASVGKDAPVLKDAVKNSGQLQSDKAGAVGTKEAWNAIEYLIEQILPTAEAVGVRVAIHPHDPAFPNGGLNGVEHVVGTIEGMWRLMNLAPESPSLGLNFCQGTIAEMSDNPNAYVLRAIAEFGKAGKIFMVHFRNIQGGYLDFMETFPDDGNVDMPACIRAYRKVGYRGILCPDHVPLSDLDPGRERFFSFALGYTKALLQAIP